MIKHKVTSLLFTRASCVWSLEVDRHLHQDLQASGAKVPKRSLLVSSGDYNKLNLFLFLKCLNTYLSISVKGPAPRLIPAPASQALKPWDQEIRPASKNIAKVIHVEKAWCDIVSMLQQSEGVIGKSRRRRGWISKTSWVFVEYGHFLIINLSSGIGSWNPSLWAGRDWQCNNQSFPADDERKMQS